MQKYDIIATQNDHVDQIGSVYIELVPCFINIMKPKLYQLDIHKVAYEWHTNPTNQSWEVLSTQGKREKKHYYTVKSTGVKLFDFFTGKYPELPRLRTDILEYCHKILQLL